MILPNFRPPYLTPIKIITSSGADVVPNAINWGQATYDVAIPEYTTTEKQVTGINQTITLKLTGAWGVNGFVYVRVNSTPLGDGWVTTDPVGDGFSTIAVDGTFTVSNNQYVGFACDGFAFGPGGYPFSWTVTVKNNSDGDTILDTFDCVVQQSATPP
jgi:hypothetical protein